MTIFWLVILGLTMGMVFGIALEKSRVMEPGVLIGQFLMRDFTMLKMFLSATATGLIALAIMTGLGIAELHPKGFVVGNVMIGGVILGIGIAIAGACPGTVFAQIGKGYKDAWLTIIGGLGGAAVYGYNKAAIDGAIDLGNLGKITFADLFPAIPFWVLALITAGIIIAFIFFLESWKPWTIDRAADLDDDEENTKAHPANV